MIPNFIIVSYVQSWFVARQQESTSKVPSLNDTSKNQSRIPETCPLNNGHQSSQILKGVCPFGNLKRAMFKIGKFLRYLVVVQFTTPFWKYESSVSIEDI